MPVDVGTAYTATWKRPVAAAVTLTVTAPDGQTSTPAVTLESGVCTATVPTPHPGRYLLHWADTTGPVTHADVVDVWPADPRFLISLADARAALRFRDKDAAASEDDLRLYIAAATEVLEDITGAILIRTIVQPSDGGRSGVALWERPHRIISVTVNGEDTTAYVPNLNAGIVYAGAKGDGRFPAGRQNIVVTYETGGAEVSMSIQLAARELVRHLWSVGRPSGQQTQAATASEQAFTPSGFAVPKRVIELCHNTYRLPGTG